MSIDILPGYERGTPTVRTEACVELARAKLQKSPNESVPEAELSRKAIEILKGKMNRTVFQRITVAYVRVADTVSFCPPSPVHFITKKMIIASTKRHGLLHRCILVNKIWCHEAMRHLWEFVDVDLSSAERSGGLD
ncbi:uncharacterized protein KD926_006966 [Aspergillus affinis]|uniref:uncharacterized protein n=1 Tax=Aspergillus affinis TaxID=1070780 RepID=UPI0022FF2E96|nr:uncharacterized protein KD926_006966 [Aspergillus affinis]KAI9041390.1 hypothetical protein KD926_006966 [Aspergillus affinis]